MHPSDTQQRNEGEPRARPPIDLDAGRRTFFKASGLALASATLLGTDVFSPDAFAQSAAPTDVQILNFALNLEYLEGEFYSRAVSNIGLESQDTTGVGGDPGPVSGGRKVSFSNPLVVDIANEIANDEIAHIRFIRRTLGGSAAARPAIDIDGAFTAAARAAGVVGPGETFDPYASDVNFLLGAYMFEVGVTAYHGAAPLISSKEILRSAAGIMAVEAYHYSSIRTMLFSMQSADPTLPIFQDTRLISALRYTLSNPNTGVPDDQGIAPDQSTISNGPPTMGNLVPTDGDSLTFARIQPQVLNIVYGARDASKGQFFPNGINPGNAS